MFATVQFGGASRPALLIPSEAVIRTGRRTLVMLAEPGGRFRPAEIAVGREAGGRTEILAGLSEGEKVVASGQFLLDSEASLTGVAARPISAASTAAPGKTLRLYESVGRVEQVSPMSVTLSHQPVPAIGWPAMTMQFRIEDPALVRGVKVGDREAFAFEQAPAGPTIRRMSPVAGR
jgi:Cu(I)/Ag(I) efflux system membrane fusion protein